MLKLLGWAVCLAAGRLGRSSAVPRRGIALRLDFLELPTALAEEDYAGYGHGAFGYDD